MVPSTVHDDLNDAASSSQSVRAETTATERQHINKNLTSLSSGDSLHSLPLPILPFDIVSEILCRLPVKFLLQLRCVAKSWESLISDPKFAKKHLRVSTVRRHVLVCLPTIPVRDFRVISYPLHSVFTTVTTNATQLEYPPYNENRQYFLVGSCDGILCFESDDQHALLWNPSIRKFKELPPLENLLEHGYGQYGFGYDPLTDNYKVVAVFRYKCHSSGRFVCKTLVKVHTLGTNSWRTIQELPSDFGIPHSGPGIFVSGTVNWLTSEDEIILSLDLGKESYQKLSQPDYGRLDVSLNLGVLRDCLCICSQIGMSNDVWIMKEYGNKQSWTKLFTVVPYPRKPNSYWFTKVVYISEDEQVLLGLKDLWGSKLVVYDSRNSTFKIPEIQRTGCRRGPEVYIESLISPCS